MGQLGHPTATRCNGDPCSTVPKQSVDGRDRRQLERLCRYVTRPPVPQDRLEGLADGRLELRLKHPWRLPPLGQLTLPFTR
jgi:hypothetical protein